MFIPVTSTLPLPTGVTRRNCQIGVDHAPVPCLIAGDAKGCGIAPLYVTTFLSFHNGEFSHFRQFMYDIWTEAGLVKERSLDHPFLSATLALSRDAPGLNYIRSAWKYYVIRYFSIATIYISSNVMVAWAVWDCNRELVSLLLTQPFGIYHFFSFFYLISIVFTYVNKGACACACAKLFLIRSLSENNYFRPKCVTRSQSTVTWFSCTKQ